ncbi:hypothetical protein ACFLSE_08800 [Bacteroidota bacterium]
MTQETNKYLNLSFYLRLFNLLLIIILSQNFSLGQVLSTDSVHFADTIQIVDTIDYSDTEFNFIMLDFYYTNNKIKNKGNIPEETVPAIISNATYLHKTGLKADVMLTNYSGADSLSYDVDFQLGFQKSFLKDYIDVDLNYLYHKYSGITEFEGINYNHALNLSTGLTYEMIYLYADGNFYLDNENYFTDFGLTINVDFENLLFKNDFLFILPTLSLTFGTDYWLYDIYEPYIENFLIPWLDYRGFPVNNLSTEVIIERYLENQGLSTNTYSYQGIDFLIPVTFGINSFSVSFSWMYYIPSDKLKAFSMKDQSGYMISLGLIF